MEGGPGGEGKKKRQTPHFINSSNAGVLEAQLLNEYHKSVSVEGTEIVLNTKVVGVVTWVISRYVEVRRAKLTGKDFWRLLVHIGVLQYRVPLQTIFYQGGQNLRSIGM